ncbi:MAG: 30S ribosomal protein S20, partial [Phycisphaerae bacterium]
DLSPLADGGPYLLDIHGERHVAHSLSAKKRIRQNVKQNGRNRWRKRQLKGAMRGFEQALGEKDFDTAEQRLRECYRVLDRVAGKGIIHKNAAGRRKAHLARELSRARNA